MGAMIWDKELVHNDTGQKYFVTRDYSSAQQGGGYTQVIGTTTPYGGITSLDETTGMVKIKSSGMAGYSPMTNLHWLAE